MSAETPASPETPSIKFTDLALPEALLKALSDVGYESPSPIQAATIPPLLAGRDVLGQAQTGTGKTAAFALPALANIDPAQKTPQVLVLAPTRELAIQVAEAFQKYAHHLPGFHVLPIYGGQSYYPQLQALKRGVQVVVGTPGRVIDHLERGSLDLSELRCLVLDEADEMLRMGFIDDVEAVLKKTPETRQVALFSATMPSQIKRIAQTYLKDPVEVAIKNKTSTAANIRQRYWSVSGVHKLDALTRILEAEPFDAMIVFARTKLGTEELADKLAARGIAAAAINGDVQQQQREKTIQNLKDGRIDVLVATDVAARGLDVERISHVLNYDIPYDTESYVHRIGRTGRAGRKGEAILFVTPRERGMLRAIERATRQPIEPMELPTIETVNEQRVSKFLGRIGDALQGEDLSLFRDLVERYEREQNVPAVEIAAALAKLVQGENPLLLTPPPRPAFREREPGPRETGHRGQPPRPPRQQRPERDAPRDVRPSAPPRSFDERNAPPRHAERQYTPPTPRNAGESMFEDDRPASAPPQRTARGTDDVGMETFRIEVGHRHGVQPGNIVGAIANEADLESRYIGRIDIRDDYSLVDLPEGMPRELMEHLKRVYVAGQALKIQRAGAGDTEGGRAPRPAGRPGGPRPGGPRGPGGHGAGPRKPFKPRPR
ncbi:DEAD/DEAH box helicase [Novilysobacter luteus]|uniref:ATP-dependent RNA helicase DeaD n=1 Tax=Novilysobacter luteus TaxID=2822368 RepID=A0ABM8UEV0_9GAMM|nr:DEAD/DEAH box helicase [Lysobacter luteus]CAG4972470.1 ATP-dependent RNA helicase DeaD [Lysobacter luteus]